MSPLNEYHTQQTRRVFLERSTLGLGGIALSSLLNATPSHIDRNAVDGMNSLPHFTPKVKRVIYLFQSGGPSQMDLFDYKPHLAARYGEEVPSPFIPLNARPR